MVEWLDPLTNAWKPVGKSKVYSNQETRDDREINLNVSIHIINACTIRGSVTDLGPKPLGGLHGHGLGRGPLCGEQGTEGGG